MKRPRLMWLGFAAAVAVVLASMGWVTAAVLRLDAAEAESQRRARLEENVRLALWRMDSALAPLIAAEHARPVAETGPAVARIPGIQTPFVRGYFRATPDDGQTYEALAAALPARAVPEPEAVAQVPRSKGTVKGAQDYQQRAANTMQQVVVQQDISRNAYPPQAVVADALRPVWSGDKLVLARRAAGAVQGCEIDWPSARAWLLDSVKDLLPAAQLSPAPQPVTSSESRLLASLPVRLEPGPLPDNGERRSTSPLRVSLIIAWACVIAATAAVGLLLAGVASLSERRGTFVSAVTHELRTPLTTLRMYTEMLAEGMVADEAQRRTYLQTLRAEADRLGHLVENVLAYSRLERNRAGYEMADTTVGAATERPLQRLAERARQAGMVLRVQIPPDVAATPIRTNVLALEQILFNLVDNACKYAAGGADRTIHLTASCHEGDVLICVRDHGPGLPRGKAQRPFRAFSKSAEQAAVSAPGLGLGLALSRRLARSIDGHLDLDRTVTDGALFVLSLPQLGHA